MKPSAAATPSTTAPAATPAAAQAAPTAAVPLALSETLAALSLKPKSEVRREKLATGKSHKFWSTQPVPQKPEAVSTFTPGPVDAPKTVADVRPEPLKLPEGYAWSTLNWDEAAMLDEAYVLLRDNYVEDDDAMFRFDYSKDFLRWALQPPGWVRDWQIGVRQSSDGQLLAMITGTPAHVRVGEAVMPMTEINYLCVHKSLRSKRLAPVLIKEVTRRVNLLNIWQAVYTAGVRIPEPIGIARYYHRSLNFQKLLDVGFTGLAPRQTITRMNRLLQLDDSVPTKGWRRFEARDCAQVEALLKAYLSKFHVHVEFQSHEIAHWFTSRPEVVSCFVVEDAAGRVTAMGSFYHLYSTVIRNPKHNTLRAAYSFYNVPGGDVSLYQVTKNLLIEAKKERCDVFNCLDLMENRSFLEDLRFGPGDGNLHYYLFNYAVGRVLNADEIGVVLM